MTQNNKCEEFWIHAPDSRQTFMLIHLVFVDIFQSEPTDSLTVRWALDLGRKPNVYHSTNSMTPDIKETQTETNGGIATVTKQLSPAPALAWRWQCEMVFVVFRAIKAAASLVPVRDTCLTDRCHSSKQDIDPNHFS